MQFYLGTWVGTGSDANPFRPRGTDGISGWTCIDIRPSATSSSGRCLLALPDGSPDPQGAVALGTALDAVLTAAQLSSINNALGISLPVGSTRRSAIVDILTTWGDQPGKWRNIAAAVQLDGSRRLQVCLGNEVIHDQPVVSGGAGPFVETFTHADQTGWTGIALTWTNVPGTGSPSIVSNRGSNATGTATTTMRAGNDATGNNNETRLSAAVMELSTSSVIGACARHQSAADTCYIFIRQGNTTLATFTYAVNKRVGGANTTLSGPTTFARGATGTAEALLFTVSGSTLTAFINGVQKVQITDTAITTGTRGGVRIGSAAVNTTAVDNYRFGDIGTTDSSLAGKAATASSAKASLGTARPVAAKAATSDNAKAVLGKTRPMAAKAATSDSAKATLGKLKQLTAKAATSDGAKATALSEAKRLTAKAATAASAKATRVARAVAVSVKAATSDSAKATRFATTRPLAAKAATASSAKARLDTKRSELAAHVSTASSAKATVRRSSRLTAKAATSSSAKATLGIRKAFTAKAATASSTKARLVRSSALTAKAATSSSARASTLRRVRGLLVKAATSSSAKALARSTRPLTGKAATASSAKALPFDKAGTRSMQAKAATSSSAKAALSVAHHVSLAAKVPISSSAKATAATRTRGLSARLPIVSSATASRVTRGVSVAGRASMASSAAASRVVRARSFAARAPIVDYADAVLALRVGLAGSAATSSSATAALFLGALTKPGGGTISVSPSAGGEIDIGAQAGGEISVDVEHVEDGGSIDVTTSKRAVAGPGRGAGGAVTFR